MVFRRKLLKASIASAVLAATAPFEVQAYEQVPVVATFSILGDMVERIGGNAVKVTSLVGRNGDTHVYQPTPADAGAVKSAKILFVNGLEFEGWLERLAEAAEFNGEMVVTTDGMDVLAFDEHGDDHHDDHDDHKDGEHHDDDHDDHKDGEHHDDDHDDHKDGEHHDDDHDDHKDGEHHDDHHDHDHGEFDPHAWQSLKNAMVYADNIASALVKISPDHANIFEENRAAYVAEIEALDKEIQQLIAQIPEDARTVVTSHDAFQYFGRDYGLKFLAPQGLSTESEASAKDVASLIEQIREDEISAVFVENITDPRLIQTVANETGIAVGGELYPGTLSEKEGPAPTYLELMRHNATTIAQALREAQ